MPAGFMVMSERVYEALPAGRFGGREAFRSAIRAAFAAAADQGWSEIRIADADFADWPLDERALDASLRSWARTGRRFVMLARGYDEVVRRHARFVAWRRTWDHIVECRSARHVDAGDFPSLLSAPHWALQRLDVQRCVGVCGETPELRLRVQELLRERLLESVSAFPSTTLGL
jgi:hypothetical protein